MSAPMLPRSAFLTVDPLADFSLRYANDLSGYAALRVFEPHVVSKNTGKFYSYSKDNLKIANLAAPSGSEAPQFGYTVTSRTYTTLEKAAKQLVLERDARDFDAPIADLDQEAAMQNMDRLMLELEAAAVTLATTSTNYPAALVSTLVDGTNDWGDAGGNPIQGIVDMKAAVFALSGKIPRSLALSWQGLETLRNGPAIVDRVKYVGGIAASDQMLNAVLDVDEIIVSKCIKNTANDGAADSLSDVWGDDAVLFYKGPRGLKSMTYGKCFIANNFYTRTIDRPELGRGLGAHEVESGWEYALKSAASVSDSDNDFVAGGLFLNIF
jgi:hypothetical protein